MQTNDSTINNKTYKCRKVILDVMKRQGYDVSEYEVFSENEVNTMRTNEQLDMILKKTDDTTSLERKIYIKYYILKTLRENILQGMIDDLFETGELSKEDTLYVIIKNTINDKLVGVVKHIWETRGIHIVLQNLDHLQFNKLDCAYVPMHSVMTKKEEALVKQKYHLVEEEFPTISRFDAIGSLIALRPGDICKIIRPNKTGITELYYRICV